MAGSAVAGVAAVAVARPVAAVAVARPAAALELDPRLVERGGFIEEYPFADLSPEDPEDPREFSGGKHKRRYTKRRQKNRRTKKTKRKKTNKKKYKYV